MTINPAKLRMLGLLPKDRAADKAARANGGGKKPKKQRPQRTQEQRAERMQHLLKVHEVADGDQ